MKIYVAAFMLICGITSLANADVSFIYGPQGTTMITTNGNHSLISYPDGHMGSAMTVGNDIYIYD